jgi:hypothetical protein
MSQSQRRTFVENLYQTPFAFYPLPKPNVPMQVMPVENNAPKTIPDMPLKT